MKTPFDEDDATEYLEKNITIFCPYCGAACQSTVEDYHCGMVPLQKTVYIDWECSKCGGHYQTQEEIDD